MLGIQRYDPTAPALKQNDGADEAEKLKALQERIAARKRKRVEEQLQSHALDSGNQRLDGDDGVKGKAQAGSHPEAGDAENESSTKISGLSPSSILKTSRRVSQPAEQSPGKDKTVAKKWYLKRKLDRRKAKKRGQKGTSEAGNEVSLVRNGDELLHEQIAGEVVMDEERNAINENNREGAAINKGDVQERQPGEIPAGEQEKSVVRLITSPNGAEDARILRRQERRAVKEALRTAKAASDTLRPSSNMQVAGSDELNYGTPSLFPTQIDQQPVVPPTRKELAKEAKLKEILGKQKKQNRKALAQSKLQSRKENTKTLRNDRTQQQGNDGEETEDLNLPPTQPGVLPRFPVPKKPAAPSQRELDALNVSHELRDALLIGQSASLSLADFLTRESEKDSTSEILSKHTLERLKEIRIDSFFAVQAAVLPILLQDRGLYSPTSPPRDVCVSAPTGSGKTLAYVIPIVEVRLSSISTTNTT